MRNSKKAFTMIEFVFVILILGILVALAVPRLSATRTDAQISKARSDIASIRSAIITERQSRLIKGDGSYISGIALNTDGLFKGVLTYPVSQSAWRSAGEDTEETASYDFELLKTPIRFTYTREEGIFTCSKTAGSQKENTLCANLID